MGFSTVGEIVKNCCKAIWESLYPIYIPEPDENKWKEIAKEFEELWNFPHCVGALDGKHVHIRCPSGGGSAYFNYKGTHSIVLLAMVDAQYKFTMIDVGAYGRNNDSGIFERSSFGQRALRNQLQFPREQKLTPTGNPCPYVIVADEAFPLKPNIMRPYSRHSINGEGKKVFNYRLSRARRMVENAFGILAGRWRIFLKPIEVQPDAADYIVLAACCLHNMLRVSNIVTDFEDREKVTVQEVRAFADLEGIRRNYVREAVSARERFKEYFVSPEGTASCPWQWEAIRKGRQPQ